MNENPWESQLDDPLREAAEVIVKGGFATPALFLLELFKPLGFLTSQLLLLTEPLFGPERGANIRRYATLLENREQTEEFIRMLERGRPGPHTRE